MIDAQLAAKDDLIGRILAIERLSHSKDHAAVDKLQSVLKNDPFYAARLEAARALRRIHSDDAFKALADGLAQPDARVRQQVVSSINGFYRTDAYDLAIKSA